MESRVQELAASPVPCFTLAQFTPTNVIFFIFSCFSWFNATEAARGDGAGEVYYYAVFIVQTWAGECAQLIQAFLGCCPGPWFIPSVHGSPLIFVYD